MHPKNFKRTPPFVFGRIKLHFTRNLDVIVCVLMRVLRGSVKAALGTHVLCIDEIASVFTFVFADSHSSVNKPTNDILLSPPKIMDTWKEHVTSGVASLLPGAAHAVSVTAVGYPFDLVKSRMQTHSYKSSFDCAVAVLRQDGVPGLYRGAASPLVSHLIKRPTQFVINETLLGLGWSPFLSGAFTGLLAATIANPLQLVKINMQTRNDLHSSLYFVRSFVSENGVAALYKGAAMTATKDVTFGAMFFGTYATLRGMTDTSPASNFANGAIAHCLAWAVGMPIDYVKTHVQRSVLDDGGQKRVLQVIREGWAKGGLRTFWKGVLPACLRTLPVSGLGMLAYECTRSRV
jgi:solute carrier family 25 carnitine/acylcarnitine transporter 20/29